MPVEEHVKLYPAPVLAAENKTTPYVPQSTVLIQALKAPPAASHVSGRVKHACTDKSPKFRNWF